MPVATNAPANSQPGDSSAQPDPPQSTRSPTPAQDPGDPIAMLNSRGITEGSKSDISLLASALESFGEFKRSTTWNIGKEWATQLIAIMKLLREASRLYGNNRLAANNDLQKAVADIKEAAASGHGQVIQSASGNSSYAAAAKWGIGAGSKQVAMQKQMMMADLQQKQILVSLKNVPKEAPLFRWEPSVITRFSSGIIAT
ncbi:hypothetical protein JB92DRAFT_3120742 [Gautieria morchelliformis]|nr:hypothetical protein JB92DRAFT_3120742 [Gautieria morchelliformis]